MVVTTPTESKFFDLVREGVFEVLEDGSIWRLKDRRLKPDTPFTPHLVMNDVLGYKHVVFWADGKRLTVRVHRAVYITFCGDIPDGYVINHLNGEKTDNRPANLEAVTHAENLRHAREVICVVPFGEKRALAKIKDDDATRIREAYARGDVSMKRLGALFGIAASVVHSIVHRRSWKHVS